MDLSRIPEPLRGRLEEQLSRVPAEVRATLEAKLANLPANQLEAVLKKTAPMLERLAGASKPSAGPKSAAKPSAGKTGTASKTGSTTGQPPKPFSIFDPHDHYNNTIQRGDRDSPPFFVIMFVLACAAVFAQTLGWFD